MKIRDKIISICGGIILIFIVSPAFNYPSDNIFCNEDYWIKQLESSKEKIIARSFLLSEGKYSYHPENAIDKKNNTCWCVKGDGIDQFIIMKIPKGCKGFRITNGVAATKELYYENNRVKRLYWAIITDKNYESKNEEIHDSCKMSKPGVSRKYRVAFQTAIKYDRIVLQDTNKSQNIFFSDVEGFSWNLYQLNKTRNTYLVVGIVDIYKGIKYNDTCISEIEIIQ